MPASATLASDTPDSESARPAQKPDESRKNPYSARFIALTVIPPVLVMFAFFAGALAIANTPPVIIAKFAAYWIGLVALPGIALVASIVPRRGILFIASVGAACGYILELGFWVLTASMDQRELLRYYPLVVLVLCAWPLIHRARAGDFSHGPSRYLSRKAMIWRPWALSAAIATVASVAMWRFWLTVPMPLKGNASWSVDMWNHLGWAADALREVPPENPSVSELPMQYHWFLYGHFASTHQITGIDLTWVLGRLFLVPMLIVVPALIAATTAQLTKRVWAPVLATLLGTVAGELDLTADPYPVAFTSWSRYVGYSPSFLFSVVLLSAMLAILVAQLTSEKRGLSWWMGWAIFAILCAGAVGSKATIVPVIVGGICIAAVYQLWSRRAQPFLKRIDPGLITAGVIGVVAAGLAQVLLYGGSDTKRILVDPHIGLEMAAIAQNVDWLTDPGNNYPGLGWAAAVVAVPLALFVMLAPYAGALSLRRVKRHREIMVLLLGVVISGYAALSMFRDPDNSQHWFFVQTFPALSILGGWGLARIIDQVATKRNALKIAIGAGVVIALGIVASAMASHPDLLIAQKGRVLLRYALFIAFAIGAYLLARKYWKNSRAVLPGVAIIALVVACLPDGAMANVQFARAWFKDGIIARDDAASRSREDTSPGLRQALRWVRDNTPQDTIIAVNNHCLVTRLVSRQIQRWNGVEYARDEVCTDTRVFYYSGLSERRVYLETWTYTDESLAMALEHMDKSHFAMGTPFPERTKLNDEAFSNPTPEGLRKLYDAGVRYLVADTRPAFNRDLPNNASPRLAEFAPIVLQNKDATVYKLERP
ncbi:MAG: hypothetical protein HOQ05_02585 [Corynebacteriales bacterium]|nr:hypothetical protein [Mycobacteriales bacterium]